MGSVAPENRMSMDWLRRKHKDELIVYTVIIKHLSIDGSFATIRLLMCDK